MEKKNIKIIFLVNVIFLNFVLLTNSLSKTYYIDSKLGNDNHEGSHPTFAWKTISKINQFLFEPADSILFKSDCIWREELRISSSGSDNSNIYFGSYGKGEKPKIFGSNKLLDWKKVTSRIWKCESNISSHWLWFVNKKIEWGNKVYNYDSLINNYDFFIDSTSIYIYSINSPNDNHLTIEASARDFGIISGWYGEGKKNITIENLEICFTINSNVRAIGSFNWELKNCIIHHSGGIDESEGQGIQWEGKNGLFAKNEIFENGQHGIYLSSFGNYIVTNNIIEENEIYNNYHTAVDLMNDGGNENSHTNTTIRRNLIYDKTDFEGNEVGIQTLGFGNGWVNNVVIHHNIIFAVSAIGISLVDNSDSIFIHNNTVIETKSACVSIDNKDGYTEIFNNVGINNNYYAVLFIHSGSSKVFKNNIWYTSKESDTKNLLLKDQYFSNYNDYSDTYGRVINGSFNNPRIIVNGKYNIVLETNSICINNGIKLKYEKDFYGNVINDSIDIGAVEYKKN